MLDSVREEGWSAARCDVEGSATVISVVVKRMTDEGEGTRGGTLRIVDGFWIGEGKKGMEIIVKKG